VTHEAATKIGASNANAGSGLNLSMMKSGQVRKGRKMTKIRGQRSRRVVDALFFRDSSHIQAAGTVSTR